MYNLSKNNVLWPTTSVSRYPLSSHKRFVILKELLYVHGGANPLLILQTSSVFPQTTTIKWACLFVTGQRDKSEACLVLIATWDWGYLSEKRSQEVSRNKRQISSIAEWAQAMLWQQLLRSWVVLTSHLTNLKLFSLPERSMEGLH